MLFDYQLVVGEITQGRCIIATLVLPSLNRILCGIVDWFNLVVGEITQEIFFNSRSPSYEQILMFFMAPILTPIFDHFVGH